MLSKPIKDCGCGGGKSHCISKPENRFRAWIREELKRLDCGCGCQGRKAFGKKYGKLIGGAILADCPPGWRNDGLTCVENCQENERDDGLTCRKKCDPGWVDDGLTCRKPITSSMNACPDGSRDIWGTCWGPVRRDCIDDCFKHPAPGCRTWECGRLRWAGVDWGPKLCTSCNLRCGQTCWNIDGITKQLHQRELRLAGGEVIGQPIRGKQIRGRVNWNELGKVLETGIKDLMEGNIDLAAAFDPERNGVAAAFRKFGDDVKGALEEVGRGIKAGFDKMGDDAKRAFEELARNAERDFKQFGDDFVRAMKDPDFWTEVAAIMAEVALTAAAMVVTATGVGAALAPGLLAAAAMAGPGIRMISNAAQGRPIDVLDIVELAVAGASAAIPGMSGFAKTALQVGTNAAKIVVAGVKIGQDLGMIPSTCLGPNCPEPPPRPPFPPEPPMQPTLGGPPPPGELSDEEILKLQPLNTRRNIIRDPNKRQNPDYLTPFEFIANYRAGMYGDDFLQPGTNAIISEEDKAIEQATDIPVISPPTQIPTVDEMEVLDLPPLKERKPFAPFNPDAPQTPPEPDVLDLPPLKERKPFAPFNPDAPPPISEPEVLDLPPLKERVPFTPFNPEAPQVPEVPQASAEVLDLPPLKARVPFTPFNPDAPPPVPETQVPAPEVQEVAVPEMVESSKATEPTRIISEEELETDSFIPRAIIGGLRGGVNIQDFPIVELNIQGDEYSNPFGTMTSRLPKSQIPLTHTGAEFNPDCYARKNPEIAKESGNDKDRLTSHWFNVGAEAGLDADCGEGTSSTEERIRLMVAAEKERERIEGMKTNCAATDRFWVEAEKRCDGMRHADGRPNTDAAECAKNNNQWNSEASISFCNVSRNPDGTEKTQEQRCNTIGNYFDKTQIGFETISILGPADFMGNRFPQWISREVQGKCIDTKNIDGAPKTRGDVCTALDNYWDEAKQECIVEKNREGKPKTEKQMCNNLMNFYENGICDIGKFPNGAYKDQFARTLTTEYANFPINYAAMKTRLDNLNSQIPATPPPAAPAGAGRPKSLTLYWAEWCPHCHDIMPEWEKLGKGYKGITIEAIEEQDSDVKVNGYPTIIYRDGRNMEKYEGERTKNAILNFLKNKLSKK